MISVSEAKTQILQRAETAKGTEKKHLKNALGHVLSRDITAPIDTPLFDQSAMDGYAIRFSENGNYRLIGELAAGADKSIELQPGESVRIFTGAPVPESADAVVMQERVLVDEDQIRFENDYQPNEGENIRRQGEQLKKNEIALKKGHKINPASIGFLASMGIEEVEVIQKPTVAVLISGDELAKLGEKLNPGQIFESNSYMLQAALLKAGIELVTTGIMKDDKTDIKKQVSQAISKADVIILTGGVSVGNYDFTIPVLEEIGVQSCFHKIKQKPGKPLYFGTIENKIVFGLPGNPAAALSCFYQYVYPALQAMQGAEELYLPKFTLPLKNTVKKRKGIAQFMKGKARNNEVEVFEGQGSHILKSFAEANCQVYLSSEHEEVKKGELVEVYLL